MSEKSREDTGVLGGTGVSIFGVISGIGLVPKFEAFTVTSCFTHSHCDAMIVSALFARHAFEYVFPSAPQTGTYSIVQAIGSFFGIFVAGLSISIFTGFAS